MAAEVDDRLTPEEVAEVAQRFAAGEGCYYCAGLHDRVADLQPQDQPCPRIKRIERHADGSITVVEFWPPGTWEANILFPSSLYDEDDARG